MGWGEPHSPTTGDMESIDHALAKAGFAASDLNGYPIGLAVRVRAALAELERLRAAQPPVPPSDSGATSDRYGEVRR